MTWLLWRQHRARLALAVVLVAAFGIPAAFTGSHLGGLLNQCRASNTCGSFDLLQGYSLMRALVNLTIAVPLLIGAFWGASIIGRELETGTAALVWTQSVTRRRWVASKIGTLFVFSAVVSGAMAALVTWWSNPANATVQSRFQGLQFDLQGVVPVAYTLFAAALGLAAGVVWRRTVPAMATTVAGYVGVRLLVELLWRPKFSTPITRVTSMSVGNQPPSGSLINSTDLTLHGRVISGKIGLPDACPNQASRDAVNHCLDQAGYRIRTVYQPPGRFWTFQWIEFGIFVALAALLVTVAVVTLRRRDA